MALLITTYVGSLTQYLYDLKSSEVGNQTYKGTPASWQLR